MNVSIISFLLFLSLFKIVIAGPLPTPRHVVDVRLDRNPPDDRLPSASPNRNFVDGFSTDYHGSDSANNDLELVSGADRDVILRSRNNMAIQRRKGKVKLPSSGKGGSLKMDKAAEVTGDMSKALSAATEALQEVPVLGEALDVVTTVLKVLSKVFSAIANMERKSNEQRAAFTKQTVEQFGKKYPAWTVICVDDKHAQYFQGVEGKDWAHQNTAKHTAMGKFHYDVYAARAGIFILLGDGGYLNWAYSGGHLQTVGTQHHRLIITGGASKEKPALGKCHAHMYRYNKGDDGGNKGFDLVAIISDGKGTILGFNGEGDLSKPVSVASQLPHPVVFTQTKQTKDAAIKIQYAKTTVLTSSEACKMGKYDGGKYQQGDCDFAC